MNTIALTVRTCLVGMLMTSAIIPVSATTIIYDGYDFAADSQMTSGNLKEECPPKIRYSLKKGAWIGLAGDVSEFDRFIAWFEDHQLTQPDWEQINVLVIYRDGKCEFYSNERPVLMAGHAAIGSGAHFALGALHAGAHARDAVAVAEK